MIFPIKAETDVLMMDETDYREHMLLNSLDTDKPANSLDDQTNHTSSSAPSLMEEDPAEDDDNEFLNTEKVGEIPSNGEVLLNQESSEKPKESSPTEKKEEKSETDPAKVGIPSKFDILCGQSRICANHTGNRRFQVVLDIYSPKYDAAKSKNEKMTLTKEIVGCIASAGGRFLKYTDGLWVEISTVTARDKVSHALRTKVASWKRQQQQQQEEKSGSTTNSSSTPKKRPTHRRRSSSKRRRSSASSDVTSASDIMTSSFDGNDSASSSVMDELLKTQREIFASLTQSSDKKQIHPLKK